MKRADYELISKVISGLRGHVSGQTSPSEPFGASIKELVFVNFVPALEAANANFDADKFKKACGV